MSVIAAHLWDRLSETVDSGWCPGLVAGVRINGQTEFFAAGSLGFEDPEPMVEDTPFRISSLSKLVGGALALSKVADGTLALDDGIGRWLPALANPRVLVTPDAPLTLTVAARGPVSVRHLLTFTAGLGIGLEPTPYVAATQDFLWGPNPPNMAPEEYVARLGSLPLAYQPGERWMYHSSADVLSVLLAAAAVTPLDQLLQERISEPFGLTGTGFPTGAERFPVIYATNDDGGLFEALSYRDALAGPPKFASLAGGLVSTVPDFVRFLAGLADDAVLPAELRHQMTADQLTSLQQIGVAEIAGPDDSWGFMTAVQTGKGQAWSEPGMWGWAGGSGTSAAVYPDGDIGVVFTQRFMNGAQGHFDFFWEPFGELRANLRGLDA